MGDRTAEEGTALAVNGLSANGTGANTGVMPADFTDLIAWQEAAQLCGDVMRLAKTMTGIGAAKAAEQLVRACDSIPANIAEGYGRGFGADFARFLTIALGSATEVENHLRVAVIDGRLAERRVAPAVDRCRRVRALIAGLAKHVAARQKPRRAAPSRLT